jgi:hypothetical protein
MRATDYKQILRAINLRIFDHIILGFMRESHCLLSSVYDQLKSRTEEAVTTD